MAYQFFQSVWSVDEGAHCGDVESFLPMAILRLDPIQTLQHFQARNALYMPLKYEDESMVDSNKKTMVEFRL